MDRRLIIVARNQLPLCDYLRQQFAGDRDVEVILDRRWTERRRRTEPRALECRRADRRQEPVRDADLYKHGFAIVRRRPEVPALGEIETLLRELQKRVAGTSPRVFPEKRSMGPRPAEPSASRKAPDSANGRSFVAADALDRQENPADWQKILKKIGIASLRFPENGALCAPWQRFLNELNAAD